MIVKVYHSGSPLINNKENEQSLRVWCYRINKYNPYREYKYFLVAIQGQKDIYQREERSNLPGVNKFRGLCTIKTIYNKGSFFTKCYSQSNKEFEKFNLNKQPPFFIASSSNGNVVGVIRNLYDECRSKVTFFIKKKLMNQFVNKWKELNKYKKYNFTKYNIDDFIEVSYAGYIPENSKITAISMSQSGDKMLISVQEDESASLVCISTDKIMSTKQIKQCCNEMKNLGQRIIKSMFEKKRDTFWSTPFKCFSAETQCHFTSLAHFRNSGKTKNDKYLGVDTKGS